MFQLHITRCCTFLLYLKKSLERSFVFFTNGGTDSITNLRKKNNKVLQPVLVLSLTVLRIKLLKPKYLEMFQKKSINTLI